MGNNLKAFLIKDIVEYGENISFQYKGFMITIGQDDESNGNLQIDVAEYNPNSDYTDAPFNSFTVDRHLGSLDWKDTWFTDKEGNIWNITDKEENNG